MKAIALFLSIFLFIQAKAQFAHSEFGFGYTYTAPVNTMKKNIQQGNGFTLDFYLTPERNTRFAFGADLNYTIYGYNKSTQEYTFDDGMVAPMDVIVNNTFLNLLVGGRYYITPPEQKTIKPYVTLKGGYSWFRTNLNIYDPDDGDQCQPVDHDLLMKDGTLSVSGGGGFHWDLSSIFKKKAPDVFLFNLGANLTLGGKVNYMNTDAPSHNQQTPITDVNARFINTQTQVVHEHHVGYVYSSFVEMVEIRAGFVLRFNSFY